MTKKGSGAFLTTRLKSLIASLTIVLLCCGSMFAGGCYGKFALTRSIHDWNGTLGNKWVSTLVFWALVIVPVYEVAALGDAIIFNVVEFWSGDNPIDGGASKPATRLLADGSIEVRRGGQLYQLEPAGAGRFTLRREGKVVAHVRTTADGGLTVIDAESPRMKQLDRETLAQLRNRLSAEL